MSRRPRLSRPAVAVAVLVVGAALVAGCTSDAPPPPLASGTGATGTTAAPTPTVTPTPTATGPGAALVVVTTEPPADAGPARVFADYVAFWQRDMLALTTNDVARSGVLDYLFPPQTRDTTAYVAARRRGGVRTAGVLRIAPVPSSVTGRSAFLRDCLDQTAVFDVDRSGRRSRVQPRSALTVTMVLGTDRRWRVSRLSTVKDPNCQ